MCYVVEQIIIQVMLTNMGVWDVALFDLSDDAPNLGIVEDTLIPSMEIEAPRHI